MVDIDRALQLTEGKRGRARAQALCQRGVLLRRLDRHDEARQAFAEAAKLGSGFARKQVRGCYDTGQALLRNRSGVATIQVRVSWKTGEGLLLDIRVHARISKQKVRDTFSFLKRCESGVWGLGWAGDDVVEKLGSGFAWK